MTRSIILALNHPIGRIFIEEIDRSKIYSWKYSFINVPFADIGITKCVQFFRSFLPSVENSLENYNILPFGRTRFSFENRERETSVPFPPLVYPVFIRTGWILYPLYALTIRCFLLRDEADASCHPPIFPNICISTKFMKFINYPLFSFPSILPIISTINISFLGKTGKISQWIREKSSNVFYFKLMTVISQKYLQNRTSKACIEDKVRGYIFTRFIIKPRVENLRKKKKIVVRFTKAESQHESLISSLPLRIRIAPIPISGRNTLKE